ncbi:GNAT family N-acetyltransferase [soil metagenome]
MPAEVIDNREESRYEIRLEGELAGFAEYRLEDGQISFTHTEIAERFGGKGLGTELIAYAVADAQTRQLSILPFCSFVRAYIAERPELVELVPAERREQFGL